MKLKEHFFSFSLIPPFIGHKSKSARKKKKIDKRNEKKKKKKKTYKIKENSE